MRRDSRLSRALHVLLHMARHEGAATSAAIGKMLNANPVVVRRTMGGLRDAGYVCSEKGHGGGWTLCCDLNTVTLHDIYVALDEPTVFALGIAIDHPECLAEQVVNDALKDALREAEAILIARLADVTLADLVGEFDQKYPHDHGDPLASFIEA